MKVFIGIGLIVTVVGVAQAQTDTSKSKPNTLAPVVVHGQRASQYAPHTTSTATKTDTPLRDVPQAVATVTSRQIADQRMESIAEVVRYVPGVAINSGEGNRDTPIIRGQSTTADFFVDGVRDDAQYFRDLYNSERVESLRGSNAMIFGRGGGGGVINRVTKEASWTPAREIVLEGGSHDHKRFTLDAGQAFNSSIAGRFNAVYQNSGLFRSGVRLRRYGVNPTATALLGANTKLVAGYEYFDDRRTADRGIPSFEGAPSPAPRSTFFGQRDSSYVTAHVHAASALLEHHAGDVTIRNRSRFNYYDKFYQNVFADAVDATATNVALKGYSNATQRKNLFNQTEAVVAANTGGVRHTLLGGVEVGHQITDNRKNTAYFGSNDATSLSVAFDDPTISSPVTFHPSATDADNHIRTDAVSVYVQDQVELTRYLQLVGGLRAEHFRIAFHDNRDDSHLARSDRMLSPRGGVVVKPVEEVSVYGSYGVSYLPSSGDQFSSLTATTETLEPEQFRNREIGVKWDVLPALALNAAAYRLDRTNTSAKDPNDPSKTVQTGAQRTTGFEVGLAGNVTSSWQTSAAFSHQRARIVSTTASAPAGATTPLVPATMVSVWNKYRLPQSFALGLGVVHRTKTYAAIDNSVTLPGFTHVDGALYLPPISGARLQLNVENVFNSMYYNTANGNNNILPGAPRTYRLSVITAF